MKKVCLVLLMSLFLSSSVAFANQPMPVSQDGTQITNSIVLFDDTFPSDPPEDPDDPGGFV